MHSGVAFHPILRPRPRLRHRRSLHHRPGLRRGLSAAVGLVVPVLLTACAADPAPPDPGPGTVAVPSAADQARDQLAARAAAAEDRHLTALYTLTASGRPPRTVSVTEAADGTWRVDIPGGALGGAADVAIARIRDGLFQCALQSAVRPDPPTCVRVADRDGSLPAGIDPRVQHLFTDWRDILTRREAPLSIGASRPLPGTTGSCFSVDTTSASLAAPLDVGIYCYLPDGTLTGARLGFGTLVLAGAPTAGPATITLPGPVVAADPLATTAPPSATDSGSPVG